MITINTTEDLAKAIETRRIEKGLSERQLSVLAGKSPSIYWWWKKKAHTTSVATAVNWCKALGLELAIVPEKNPPK